MNEVPVIERPIVVIGAPRSGTTILQRCLALQPRLWHLRAESHYILEGPFHPKRIGRSSNRCAAEDTSELTVKSVRQRFYQKAINVSRVLSDPGWLFRADGLAGRILSAATIKTLGYLSRMVKPSTIRFLEKTPKNSLRVSLLNRLFPDALFVLNRRRPEENIDSLIAGWHTSDKIGPIELPRFSRFGYPVAEDLKLKDYSEKWWKFALVPGWKSLQGKSVGEVAAFQYYQCNRCALEDFEELDEDRTISIKHERFVQKPTEVVSKILERAGLSMTSAVKQFAKALPRVNSTRDGGGRHFGELRYPEQVRCGMKSIPQMTELQSYLGYS